MRYFVTTFDWGKPIRWDCATKEEAEEKIADALRTHQAQERDDEFRYDIIYGEVCKFEPREIVKSVRIVHPDDSK